MDIATAMIAKFFMMYCPSSVATKVPVRLRGVEKILHRGEYFPRPGTVEVTFGQPLHLTGDDYPALARQVEQAVRDL